MKIKVQFLILVSILGFLVSAHAQNKFSDVTQQKIYEYQDRRETKKLLPFLNSTNAFYRYSAILAFASIQDITVTPQLFARLKVEKFVESRMAAVYTIGQLRNSKFCNTLISYSAKEKNRLVLAQYYIAIGKCANIKAIDYFKVNKPANDTLLLPYLKGLLYAKRNKITDADLKQYVLELYPTIINPEIKEVCELIIGKKVTEETKDNIVYNLSNKAILDSLFVISNPYAQVDFLKKCNMQNGYIIDFVSDVNLSIPLRTYAAEKYLKDTMEKAFLEKILISYIRTQNVAFISLACERIRKDSLWMNKNTEIMQELLKAKSLLVMPRDYEAFVDIEKTIQQFNRKKYTYKSPAFNHPINWKYVNTIKANQSVKIVTNKGNIILECKVNDAPGSVANFMFLLDSGYYNGKYFHRMVPNFVVQGGCPRGDGWGSLNWTQRSEFSNFLTYKPGSVGIASSGKDSEGVQFFITHTYTSHLDGRYTIFAEVIEGMDIVNQLGVGDIMIKVERVE